MNNNVCNISFKSNIKFCTKEEFEANKPKNFFVEYPKDYNKFFKKQKKYKQQHPDQSSLPWNIKSIRTQNNITTGKIFTCSAGGITGKNNHKKQLRYHFVPEDDNIKQINSSKSPIFKKLLKGCNKIKDKKKNGFLIGGDNVNSSFKKISKHLFLTLKSFFRKSNIELIYFWGQNGKDGVDAYYTACDDTWRILKNKNDIGGVIQTPKDIFDAFKFAKLSKYDKLFLPNSTKSINYKTFNNLMRKYKYEKF